MNKINSLSQINNANRRISVAEMAPHIHSFAYGENKTEKLKKWLIDWIEKSLNTGFVKPYDFLPAKSELAFHIGVSLGTMQNVFRAVEDYGIIESKQKIGTYIIEKNTKFKTEKLTSKREFAVEKIKNFILNKNYKEEDILPSTRKLAKEIRMSSSTIRNALDILLNEKIIVQKGNVFIVKNVNFKIVTICNQTLVEKVAEKISKSISSNLNPGDKLPSNHELAKIYNVSIKTIHDSLKVLSKEGKIIIKRGQYGTIVANSEEHKDLYFYEKVEQKIREFIKNNCSIGEKLPSIKDFSQNLNVSTKTVKKALDNLLQDGYVTFTRGRHGGTFVTDIPQQANDAYTWLAISPNFLQNNEN